MGLKHSFLAALGPSCRHPLLRKTATSVLPVASFPNPRAFLDYPLFPRLPLLSHPQATLQDFWNTDFDTSPVSPATLAQATTTFHLDVGNSFSAISLPYFCVPRWVGPSGLLWLPLLPLTSLLPRVSLPLPWTRQVRPGSLPPSTHVNVQMSPCQRSSLNILCLRTLYPSCRLCFFTQLISLPKTEHHLTWHNLVLSIYCPCLLMRTYTPRGKGVLSVLFPARSPKHQAVLSTETFSINNWSIDKWATPPPLESTPWMPACRAAPPFLI